MNINSLLFCFIAITAHQAQAVELNNQQLIEIDLLKQSMTSKSTAPGFVSNTCMPAPHPSSPKTPNYSITYDRTSTETITLTFWRENCKDGTGKALLVRAKPTKGNPFLCSPNFKVIQNGLQLNDIRLQPSSSGFGSWCDDLFVASTLIVNQYDFGEVQFNPAQALKIVYEDVVKDIPLNGIYLHTVDGSANGYKNFSYTCKNTKTNAIKTFPSQTSAEWSCIGLSIKAGDPVTATINGIAK